MGPFLVVLLATSGALVIGALWGLYGRISGRTEGLVVSAAGGALIVSLVAELIQPADEAGRIVWVVAMVIAGAVVFTGLNWAVDVKWGSHRGGGLLAAITLDGVPENLALGVAMISFAPMEIAAFIGSLVLSNLPEAAGGARRMHIATSLTRRQILAIWCATALLLALSALAGNLLLRETGPETQALFQAFAAGALAASLSTEIFPRAFRGADQWVGITTTLGVLAAYLLARMPVAA